MSDRTSKLNMKNATTSIAFCLIGMFVGIFALSFLPIPMNFRGGIITKTVLLTNGKNSGTILLTTKPDGEPSISISDAQGNSAFFLTVAKKGYPSLDISGPDGTPRVSLTTGKRPSIRVYDPSTNTVAWEVVGDAANPIKVPTP